eukprot:CAMPEP_0114522016 /NCGR_PEP_ID=MMETSP0109-20121206/20519_1 /TAXON_ID=29199 /ORGANISM="Chlorarachnion reptans, Strain CCCM449" /LENGTH=432 /DNA_ID=CAMNT_0001703209 /DNA_START=127 /DNA_END=1422 /DNA_ORIENTATION=+
MTRSKPSQLPSNRRRTEAHTHFSSIFLLAFLFNPQVALTKAETVTETAAEAGNCAEGSCPFAQGLEDLNISALSYILKTPLKDTRPMGAKFRNLMDTDLEMYWDDGSEQGVYNGFIGALSGSATLSYEGHSFIFYIKGTKERVTKITMQTGKAIYVIPPRDLEKVENTEFYQKTMAELEFFDQYQKENGKAWLSYFPRGKPILPMWPSDHLGQVISVKSESGKVVCDPSQPDLKGQNDPCVRSEADIDLRVIATEPRVFLIENLLSSYELEHILDLAKERVHRSSVGNGASAYKSNTRTSRTGWLKRTDSALLNRVFSRFSTVLNISDDKLAHNRVAENLQVVHYDVGQQYTPHHDFGDSGRPNQRFLTLFIYIHTAEEGGGTSFPKAYGGRGMQVHPKAGDALLWYNMLPDGNSDEMSLHAGMPVIKGEKW